MTFPNINYKFNDLAEAQALTDLIEQKCSVFEKYLHGDEAVKCDIEFEKITPQNSGKIFRVETNLLIDGTLFRSVATEDSFERAIDVMRDELDRELYRAKEKHETLKKQGGREMKEKMMMAE